jgi:hypothetical protein
LLTPLPASKWNESTAAHLLNRAAFGGTPHDIEATRRKGLDSSLRIMAPLFLLGGSVKPGLIGKHPSLVDLDHADLKFSTESGGVWAQVSPFTNCLIVAALYERRTNSTDGHRPPLQQLLQNAQPVSVKNLLDLFVIEAALD